MADVEEVLQQARDALERHRDWMTKRRVQRTVLPTNVPAGPVSESSGGDMRGLSWAVSGPTSKRAPPPPKAAAAKKRTKISSNQIAPSVETSVDSTDIDGERKSLSPMFVSSLKEEDKGREGVSKSGGEVSKKPLLSASDGVNPSWPGSDHLPNGHGRGSLLDVELSDEEGRQYDEVKPESNSPPPYVMSSTIAWGEEEGTSRLSNKMVETDKLATLKLTPRKRLTGTPAIHYSQDVNDTPTSPSMITPISPPTTQSSATTISSPIAIPMGLPVGTPTHQSITVSGSPLLMGDNDSLIRDGRGEESDTNEEHYKMVQESSSARVVAVSPAPREQRTTFSAHTKSKIGLADATGTIYDYRVLGHDPEASKSDAYQAPSFHGDDGPRKDTCFGEVPSANVQMVLPAKLELGARREDIEEPAAHMRNLAGQTLDRHPEDTTTAASPGLGNKDRQKVVSEVRKSTSVPQATGMVGDMSVTDSHGDRDSIRGSQIDSAVAATGASLSHGVVNDGRVRLPAIVKDPVIMAPKKMENGSVAKKKKKKKPPQKSTLEEAEPSLVHLPQKNGVSERDPGSFQELSGGSHHTLVEGSLGVRHKSEGLQEASEEEGEGRTAVGTGDHNTSGTSAPSLRAGDEVQHTDLYVDGSQLVKELPPLKITSLLPALMEGMNVHPKRSRDPPGYDIHQPKGALILSPPCPLYGEEQPNESDTLKQISWQYGGAKDSGSGQKPAQSSSESRKQVRPVWSRSKSTGAGSSGRLGRSSSTLVLNGDLTGDDQPLARATSEQNVSDVSHAPHISTLRDFSPGPGPLHIAAKLGNLRRVQALLDQGHDVDMPDEAGRTPLMYCIQADGVHLSCADALIQYGANLDKQTSDGATAVHIAAAVGALSILELLLLNHAQPDVQDFEGRRPIHWATLQNSAKVFTLLLNRCGPVSGGLESVDDAGMTVLMWAAYHDNHRIVSFLMDQGADTEEKDKDGYTAMHWAIHKESSRSLQLLLKPDMTYFKDHLGKTLMHLAAEKGSMGACEVVLKLRPDAIHDRDKMGRSPLHYSAACSRVDVCALLLDYGADASQKDAFFNTALDYAREKKLDYVVALLSCHGNAVADFARASRSVSVSSLLSRSVSFSQLPTRSETTEDDVQSTASTVNNLASSSPSPRQQSASVNRDASTICGVTAAVDPAKGGYLGRFFPDDKDLVKHYFYRLNEQEGSISWSRSREGISGTSSKALVLEVHGEPSNTVRGIANFSPADLHYYTFWVGTSGGVLDLLAYNEDAYNVWLLELERVAGRNANLSRSAVQQFKGSSVHSRPVSSHSSTRQTTARVAAATSRGQGLYDNNLSGEEQHVDMSHFVRTENTNSELSAGYNANISSKRVQFKSRQVIPLARTSEDSLSPSSRRSELSFVGETYQTSGRPTSLQVDSYTQGTVI